MDKLVIELESFGHSCSDGCCYDYGTITRVNGVELASYSEDTGTILKQVLEHLGYEVELKDETAH